MIISVQEPAGADYYMRYAEVEFIKAEAYARADLLNDAALLRQPMKPVLPLPAQNLALLLQLLQHTLQTTT